MPHPDQTDRLSPLAFPPPGVASPARRWSTVVGLAALSAALLVLDGVTPPDVLFVATLALPVAGAAWFLGGTAGAGFALALAGGSVWIEISQGCSLVAGGINLAITLGALCALVALIRHVARQQAALAERVETLEGILPTCAYCRRIRDEDGTWSQMERYISQRSRAQFSHGICPACAKEHLSEYQL